MISKRFGHFEVNTASTVKLILLNSYGIVPEQTQQVNKGVETVKLPINALPVGMYHLQVFLDNEMHSTETFIKI
ncbi:hypothetical protein [Winogradskyella sp. R77965]|uniref:hypothetical protein n=1 Tax=Winogradskyella sp. R77965 TaxID=3093872 RepID=UPI0037DC2A4C